MNLMDTMQGSLLENFFPAGWDLAKMDACIGTPEDVLDRQSFWHRDFTPVQCESLSDFDVLMGHEIALQIKETKDAGRKCAFILPVGPMGMYKWVVYFLKSWNVDCKHVTTFNMDEWADGEGNTLPSDNPAAFQYAMEQALFNPLGELTVPADQRNFATRDNLPTYPGKIAALKAEGAKLVLVYGVGRMCHIAFWEPMMGGEFDSDEEWAKQPYRLGMKLHPLTIEQNAITSFKSRTTLVPCRANTIGPGLVTGGDLLREMSRVDSECVLITECMLRSEGDRFLDDRPLTDVIAELGRPIVPVGRRGEDLLEAILARRKR